MINIIPAKDRYFKDLGWLKARWLFSFDDYVDPGNSGFGKLRVFNDDQVAPHSGFPPHPHREMEIVTIILEGEITHEDSMGNKAVLKPGDIQRMSAGTGVTHSEFNNGDEMLNLFQIWIRPRERHLEPSYQESRLGDIDINGKLVPLVSGYEDAGALTMNCDAVIYMSKLGAGEKVMFKVREGHGLFIYVMAGSVSVNGSELKLKDQARINEEKQISFEANEPCQLIAIEVAM